jgi:hypothetical protein
VINTAARLAQMLHQWLSLDDVRMPADPKIVALCGLEPRALLAMHLSRTTSGCVIIAIRVQDQVGADTGLS